MQTRAWGLQTEPGKGLQTDQGVPETHTKTGIDVLCIMYCLRQHNYHVNPSVWKRFLNMPGNCKYNIVQPKPSHTLTQKTLPFLPSPNYHVPYQNPFICRLSCYHTPCHKTCLAICYIISYVKSCQISHHIICHIRNHIISYHKSFHNQSQVKISIKQSA